MIQDIMPGTEEKLMEGPQAAYVGIDPTADSLHIGHLVSVMILKHFQRCGHKPIALVGGATGMIGDPSMKSAERNLLDEETLRHNVECIKAQLGRFLSALFMEGSPIIPVAPPTSAIGLCPHLWKCFNIITLTRWPICSESAVGSIPT